MIITFAEMHLLHCIKEETLDLVRSSPIHVRYLTTLSKYTQQIVSFLYLSFLYLSATFNSSPLRLIPNMKHLFKRHEAQFFRLSLSMVQSFRLAHRWFCLPGGTQKSRGMRDRIKQYIYAVTLGNNMWVFTDNKLLALTVLGHCALPA